MDVVEVLALPEVVVEAAEDDQVPTDEDHAVAAAGGGATGGTGKENLTLQLPKASMIDLLNCNC